MFHGHPHWPIVYSHTGYDVTSYFRPEIIAKLLGEKCRNAASDGFEPNFSWTAWGQRTFKHLLGIISLSNLLDMTSLATYKIQLNTAQKCVKRVRPTKSRITWPLFNVESPHFLQGHQCRPTLQSPDMPSPATFVGHLSKYKKGWKCRRRLRIEFVWRGVLLGHTNWWTSCF